MFSQDFVISNPTGIHARPAGELVKLCKSIPADITIVHPNGSVNPKGILAVLTAGLKKGTPITVQVEGEDEERYGQQIIDLLTEFQE